MSVIISGGCVRLYPATHETPGPQWHTDAGHSTIGVIDTSEPPTIDAAGFIVVKLVGAGTRAVVSMTAASDETLTAKGVGAGCSNGGPICRIRLYKDGVGALDLNKPDHWALVAGAYNNLWLTLVHVPHAEPGPADPCPCAAA